VRGAFTGATHPKDGLLAIAEGGTVFLDEIGETADRSASEDAAGDPGKRDPAGGKREADSHQRADSGRHQPRPGAGGRAGAFRRDLFFRLNVLTLRIPPLRERRQDVPLLVAHCLERLARETGIEKTIADDTLKTLLNYDWPGNVRELETA